VGYNSCGCLAAGVDYGVMIVRGKAEFLDFVMVVVRGGVVVVNLLGGLFYGEVMVVMRNGGDVWCCGGGDVWWQCLFLVIGVRLIRFGLSFRFKPASLPVFCCSVSSSLDSCLCGVCFLVRRFDEVVFVVVVVGC